MNALPRLLVVVLCMASVHAMAQGSPSAECPANGGPADARRSLVFEVPNAIEEVNVSGQMEALGVPVKLRAVRSSSHRDDLVAYFKTAFAKAGLWVVPEPMIENPGWGTQVVGYDAETRISYSVFFQENRDGSTTAVLGKAYVADRHEQTAADAFAPVFPGAEELIQSNLEGARTLAYETRAKPPDVTRFYREVLGRDGFKEVGPGIFSREKEQLRIQLNTEDEGKLHVLVLQQLGAPLDYAWKASP